MSNRNKSHAPQRHGGELASYQPRQSPFEEFDRMADRMFAGFGMPRMDMSKILRFNSDKVVSDPFRNDPFFSDMGFGRMD